MRYKENEQLEVRDERVLCPVVRDFGINPLDCYRHPYRLGFRLFPTKASSVPANNAGLIF
ncbi:MAG: hypothetical protein A2W61_05710 [Deltaproteobacteria bacterium RIFCSPLOWO2_01_44_7]|nr:MAG: hypothetical protein A2W61_05710 [Deltaproteobacteria bacterium RIFCSPLOWO2_01_44_7]